jgi:hypothetical protein
MSELSLRTYVAVPLFLLIIGCSSKSDDPRYFDYSGADGCVPPNIGHRLGGDLPDNADNSIEGIHVIQDLQSSRCFKNWEFDLNESASGLVLMNSSEYNGFAIADQTLDQLPSEVVTAAQLTSAFSEIRVTKPIIIDLKTIKTPRGVQEAKDVAQKLLKQQAVDIWFISSKENASVMPDICRVLGRDFDLLLYDRGGSYCKSNL